MIQYSIIKLYVFIFYNIHKLSINLIYIQILHISVIIIVNKTLCGIYIVNIAIDVANKSGFGIQLLIINLFIKIYIIMQDKTPFFY